MNPDPNLALDRRLLAAAERLGQALRAARQQVATRHGLSQLQVQVLHHLGDGRAARVGEIAAALDVSQPTVSDALAALRRKGLVGRAADPADGRAARQVLTPRGREVAEAADRELEPLVDVVHPDPAARAVALRVLLQQITHLQAVGVITVNRCCLSCTHYGAPRPRRPARCHLMDVPLPESDLRVDCPDHRAA